VEDGSIIVTLLMYHVNVYKAAAQKVKFWRQNFQTGGVVEHPPVGVDERDGQPDEERADDPQAGKREASGHRRSSDDVDVNVGGQWRRERR